LGHAIFERTGPRCPRRGAAVEQLCDKIAAEILMPTKPFRAALGASVDVTTALELSERFETSIHATAIRIARFTDVAFFATQGQDPIWTSNTKRSDRNRLEPLLREIDAPHGNKVLYLDCFAGGGYYYRVQWKDLAGGKRVGSIKKEAGPDVED